MSPADLVFPDRINGKTPDQMNADEFEEYLGLGHAPTTGQFETQRPKTASAID